LLSGRACAVDTASVRCVWLNANDVNFRTTTIFWTPLPMPTPLPA